MRTIRRQAKATSLDHAIELAKRHAKEQHRPSKVMADLMGVELKTYYRWLLDNTLPLNRIVEARACRLVVLPEWQGAGVGTRFLNGCAEMWLRGENRYHRPLRTLINTSHPGLAAALRRNPQWTQVSAALYGADKLRCRDSLRRSALKHGKDTG